MIDEAFLNMNLRNLLFSILEKYNFSSFSDIIKYANITSDLYKKYFGYRIKYDIKYMDMIEIIRFYKKYIEIYHDETIFLKRNINFEYDRIYLSISDIRKSKINILTDEKS